MLQPIEQERLARIARLRAQIKTLRRELRALEASVRHQLQSGAEIASGVLAAHLIEIDHSSPAWTKISERLIQLGAAEPPILQIDRVRR